MSTTTLLLPVHIAAGVIATAVGFVALFALKGAALHRQSGMIFVFTMLTMSATGTVMAVLQPNRGNVMAGLLTFYLVATALLTTRRHVPRVKWLDGAALTLGLASGALGVAFGTSARAGASGKLDGYPSAFYFVFAALALLASSGDVRMLVLGAYGKRRIVRHLWRMSVALFIASASFFLGQAKVFPRPLRIMPLLSMPVLLVLITMLYWLARPRAIHAARARATSS